MRLEYSRKMALQSFTELQISAFFLFSNFRKRQIALYSPCRLVGRSVGWYLVILGQFNLVLFGIKWYWVIKGLLCLYILKKLMVTSTNRPTNRQGEYRAICLFRKLENRKKAENCNKGPERKAHSRKAEPFCTRLQFSLTAHPCTPECALGHEVMYGALSQDLLAQNAVKCSDTIRELARKVQPTVRQEIGGAWNNR